MIASGSPTASKFLSDSGDLTVAGGDSLGGKPWKSLARVANFGSVIATASRPAVAPSHPWLRMVGTIPNVTEDYAGSADGVTDGVLTAYFLNRRQWARPSSPVRVPKTLLIVGYSPGFLFREYLMTLLGPLTAIGVDVIEVGLDSANHSICPLLGAVPVINSEPVVIGSMVKGPGTQPAVAYRSVSCPAAADFSGGQLLVVNIGRERLEFGRMTSFSATSTGPPSGVDEDPTGSSLHYGYVFRAFTEWDIGNDPGAQAFDGCDELGSTLDSGSLFGARIQMFLNTARAEEDIALLTPFASRFHKFHISFRGNESVSTGGGTGLPSDAESLNPGDPADVVAALDGGTGLVSYEANTGDVLTDDSAAEDLADSIAAQAIDFFS